MPAVERAGRSPCRDRSAAPLPSSTRHEGPGLDVGGPGALSPAALSGCVHERGPETKPCHCCGQIAATSRVCPTPGTWRGGIAGPLTPRRQRPSPVLHDGSPSPLVLAPTWLWAAHWAGDPRLSGSQWAQWPTLAERPSSTRFWFPGSSRGADGCVVFAKSLRPLVTENPVRPPSAPPEKPGGPPGGGVTDLWAPSGAFSVSSCGLSHTTDPAPLFSFLCPPVLCQTPHVLEDKDQVHSALRVTITHTCKSTLVCAGHSWPPCPAQLGRFRVPRWEPPSLPTATPFLARPGARLDSGVLV